MSRNPRVRVLVTDGSYKHALGIVRHLAPRYEMYAASSHRLSTAGASRFALGLRCPPIEDESGFLAWLDVAVEEHRIDHLIAVGAASCGLLSQHPDRWLPRARLVLPPSATVGAALDKRSMHRLAARLGVPVPRSVEPPSPTDVAAAGAEVGFPLVIKGPIEGPTDVGYVERAADLGAAYRAYLERNAWPGPPWPLLQQRIQGDGYGVFATYQEGSCRRIMAHRRVREYPASGGPSTCAELVLDDELFELGRRILDELHWHGVAMVEFKRHLDGRYYLMEVNPKFWGSLDLALAAGADFPGDLIRIGSGETLPVAGPPRPPLRFCWPIGDVLYLSQRPRELRAVVRDWFDPRVATNIRLSDPLPNLIEAAAAARALWRARRQRSRRAT